MNDTLTGISLCTGGGGLDIGVELALGDVRWLAYVEREGFCLAVLDEAIEAGFMADGAFRADLRTFDATDLRGRIDIIAGGYPCQPFSVAGRRRGVEDERHLWPDVARIVGECRPAVCFFENVSGHLRLGFREVHGDLERMGYEVAAGLFTAEEIGASHKRERLFILAVADGTGFRRPPGQTGRRACAKGDGKAGCVKRTGICGADVADPEGPERGRLDLQGQRPQRGAVSGGTGEAVAEHGRELPLFPPGPNDLDAWRRVLEIDPSLEPALCRMVDGMAARVDRLRMLGNGVVPLQAAYAFTSLWASLAGVTP